MRNLVPLHDQPFAICILCPLPLYVDFEGYPSAWTLGYVFQPHHGVNQGHLNTHEYWKKKKNFVI